MTDSPPVDEPTLSGRADLAARAAAREIADRAYAYAALPTPATTTDALEDARAIRYYAAVLVQRAIVAALTAGVPERDVARVFGLTAGTVRAQYARHVDDARASVTRAPQPGDEWAVGVFNDPDPVESATALDAWAARHTEPWDAPPAAPGPAVRALFARAHEEGPARPGQ